MVGVVGHPTRKNYGIIKAARGMNHPQGGYSLIDAPQESLRKGKNHYLVISEYLNKPYVCVYEMRNKCLVDFLNRIQTMYSGIVEMSHKFASGIPSKIIASLPNLQLYCLSIVRDIAMVGVGHPTRRPLRE
jgi:hypothetical protein